MRVDPEQLRRHYRSLSDDELLATDTAELTEAARQRYDDELANRRLRQSQKPQAPQAADEPASGAEGEIEPDWLASAGCACSFVAVPGGNAAENAARAQDVLEQAGIPGHLSVGPEDPGEESSRDLYQVMVPGALLLKALSVLDRDMFNEDLEPEWRSHLAQLTGAELRLLNPDDICAGLLDRAQRLRRVYYEELARRAARSSSGPLA